MRAIAIRNGKNAGGFWVCARVMLCSFRLWFEREKNTHMGVGVGEILGSSGRLWRGGCFGSCCFEFYCNLLGLRRLLYAPKKRKTKIKIK
jgi:hypothetical protein